MLFESNTLVTLLLHLTTKTGLIVETFSKFLDVFEPIILKVHTFWRWNHHNIKLQTHYGLGGHCLNADQYKPSLKRRIEVEAFLVARIEIPLV